jgi:adenylate cyclase
MNAKSKTETRKRSGAGLSGRHLIPYAVGFAALFATLALAVSDFQLVERVRYLVFDSYQRLTPRATTDEGVRIIDIDNKALAELGQWPWSRRTISEMTERLTEVGVAAIAFDIVFAEPDRTSPEQILALYPETPAMKALREERDSGVLAPHDSVLAGTFAEAPVVAGISMTNDPANADRIPEPKLAFACAGSDARAFVPTFAGAVANLPVLQDAAPGTGSFGLLGDGDGVVRRVPLVVTARQARLDTFSGCENLLPSLSLEALRIAEDAKRLIVRANDASGEVAIGADGGLVDIVIGNRRVPVARNGEFWVHFSGSDWTDRTISAADLFGPDYDPDRLRAELNGRIVFVGTSAEGLQDLKATPFGDRFPGVIVHAEVVEQIRQGHFLTRPDWAEGAELFFLAAFGLVILVLLPRIGAFWGVLVALGGVATGPLVSWHLFSAHGFLFDPVYPVGAAMLVYASMSAMLFMREEREKGQVRNAFGRYLSPALVERLADDPSQLKLGGEVRELTVLFSDIRNFTGIAEGLEADHLTRLINAYLTPMTASVLSREGTIDKYMGDAIMAFWNAPLPVDDHARKACHAALEMKSRLDTLNPRWRDSGLLTPGTIMENGIGLNTGPACVGNLGSEQRFDYSVLGDVVNAASRLEGQTRFYGIGIIAGESTVLAAPDFAWLEIDLLRVKGKELPLRIYGLIGDASVAREGEFTMLKAGFERALALYRARDWSGAMAALEDVAPSAERYGAGELHEIYRARIDAYRQAPPPADWDGVTIATTK